MKRILEALGWEEIESKNKYMISFRKEDKRLNYYFTTGTVTIQSSILSLHPITKRDITTEEQMEEVIENL